MSKLARKIGIKATKATARHTAHGVASKAQRRPLRGVSLLGMGVVVGLGAGFAAGRRI